MALDSTTHSAFITELREWFGETASDFNTKWSQTITVYKVLSSISIDIRTVDNLMEDPYSVEILSRRIGKEWQYIVFGAHTKTDTASVFEEYFGE